MREPDVSLLEKKGFKRFGKIKEKWGLGEKDGEVEEVCVCICECECVCV